MGQEPTRPGVRDSSTPGPSLWPPRGLLFLFDSARGSSVPALLPWELSSRVLTWSPFYSSSSWLVPGGAWVPPWVE